MRSQEIPEASGTSYFNLGEDAHLLMKSNDDITLTTTTKTAEDFSTIQKPDRHPREASAGTMFGFPVMLADSRNSKARRRYFTLFPKNNRLLSNFFLGICYLLIVSFSFFIFVAPMVLHHREKEDWCQLTPTWNITDDPYENPDYIIDPCRYERLPVLLYFTLEECDICRRLLISVFLGGFIGYERKSADRPAGIRTMGLVSLGACFFTVSSMLAFKSSTMGWDASRVTAALPSGVGFLGGALIWKGTVFVEDQEMHQVHGLTTAASLWLSAAVGVGVGGALYLVTTYVTILLIVILRYGPKGYLSDETDDISEDNMNEEELAEDQNYDKMEDTNDDMASALSFDADQKVQPSERSPSQHSKRSSYRKLTKSRPSLKNIPTFHD